MDTAATPGAALVAQIPGQNRPADQCESGWTRDFSPSSPSAECSPHQNDAAHSDYRAETNRCTSEVDRSDPASAQRRRVPNGTDVWSCHSLLEVEVA